MGIIVKQSLRASIVSYFGLLVGAFNSLYLFPKFIGSEGIGLLSVISSAAALFLPLLQVGFNTSFVKFFPFFKDKPFASTFIAYAFFIPSLSFLIFVFCWPLTEGLFSWLFRHKAQIIFSNIQWVLPITGIFVFFGLFETLSRAHYKIVFPTIIRNFIWRILMTFGVCLIGFNYLEMDYLVDILMWSWVISFIILFTYVFSSGQFKIGFDRNIFKSKDFKRFNSFSGYVIFLAVSGVLIQKIDQLMVASYLGSQAAGAFSTAMYFATLIEIPKRSLMGIMQPILVDAFKKEDFNKVSELYKKSSLNLMLLGGTIFVLIWINVNEIFELIPRQEEFISGIFVVFFYGLAKVFDMGMGCNNDIIVFSKYYKVNLPLQFILVFIVIVTNKIFIPEFGIVGAALATFISVASYNIIRFLFLLYKMRIQPFSIKTLLVAIVLVASIFGGSYIALNINPIPSILIKSTIIGIPIVVTFYLLNISDEINLFINNFINKFKKD